MMLLELIATASAADDVCARPDFDAWMQRTLEDPIRIFVSEHTDPGRDLAVVIACQEPWFQQRNTPASSLDAARLHFVAGLVSFLQAEDPATPTDGAAWFCAVRALRPTWTLPDQLLPVGHDLYSWWYSPCLETSTTSLQDGSIRIIDGTPTDLAPADPTRRPYLVQRTDRRGRLVSSELIGPESGLAPPPPPLAVVEADPQPVAIAEPEPVPEERPPRVPSGKGVPLVARVGLGVAGAGAVAAGSGLVYTARVVGPQRYSPVMTSEEWEAYRSDQLAPTQGAGIGLIGVGAAAVTASALTFAF